MFKRKTDVEKRIGAGGWARTGVGITKTKRMSDGEVLMLLTDGQGQLFDDSVYSELKIVSDRFEKSVRMLLLAYAICAAFIINISEKISVFGFDVNKVVLPHVSLLLLSFYSWKYGVDNTRFTALRSFFDAKYYAQDASGRAKILLKYPLAFPPHNFFSSIRGFPKHVFPQRFPQHQGVALYVMLFVIFALIPLPIYIYVKIAIEVWNSNFPNSLLSKLYVVGVGVAGMAAFANPTYHGFRKTYVHHGLSNRLRKKASQWSSSARFQRSWAR